MNGTLNLGRSLSVGLRPNLHNSYFFINKLFKHFSFDLNLCPVINNELLILMLLYEPPEGLFPDAKIQGRLFNCEGVFLPPRQRNVFSYHHIRKSSCQKICSNTENRDFLLRNMKLLCQPLTLYSQQYLFYRQTELHYLFFMIHDDFFQFNKHEFCFVHLCHDFFAGMCPKKKNSPFEKIPFSHYIACYVQY